MIKGFKLLDKQYVKEEEAYLLSYIHEKSGAKLLHMKNKDDNKLFAIAFRTPPIGSTGNCHILEHSVLNGSRKYKSKEPFMDAIKSSLQTFLNAATYPDKTMYPVASRNNKDFYNLMDLYLDAVFYPRVLEDEKIFRQEGWRYEIFDKNDPIRYQGVVYNEMKGAMSSPDSQVSERVIAGLYPDTIYAQNSGGDPAFIPNLSYDEFCRYHRDHYRPSNSMTFLYGDIGKETLEHLDSYFSDFELEEPVARPKRPVKRKEPVRYEAEFSIGEGEEEDKHAYFSMGWLLEDIRTDYGRYLYKLLDPVLIESENSILRRRLMEELGAEEVYSYLLDFEDVSFAIIAKNVDADRIDDFERIVRQSLEEMLEKGIDSKVIEGALNDIEFDLREKQGVATKGILFADMAMTESLYGKDVREVFHYEDQLARLRQVLKQGAMEEYIRDKIISNPGFVRGLHIPKAGKNAGLEKETEEKLAKFKASLSQDEISELINKNKELRKRQDSPDSPEVRASIPTLKVEDLPDKLEAVRPEIRKSDNDSYLLFDMQTGGIIYLSTVFDISHLSEEELGYLIPITELMGRMDTKNYSYEKYEIETNLNTGGIYSNVNAFRNDKSGEVSLKLTITTKLLGTDRLDKALELMKEQMLYSDFSNRSRLSEQLIILNSKRLRSIISSGHSYASSRALSHISEKDMLNEKIYGLDNYKFVKKLSDRLDDEDIEKIEEIYKKLFKSSSRYISITGLSEDLEEAYEKLKKFISTFAGENLEKIHIPFEIRSSSEAFYMTSDVNYNALALKLDQRPYHASASLAENILSNSYLYNELRAKGGAYGQFARLDRESNLYMVSYRDSHVKNSYRVYEEAGRYLDNFEADADEWNRLIIGAAGSLDQALTDRQKAYRAFLYYIIDRDEDDDNKRFNELKNTSIEDIRTLGKRIRAAKIKSSCSLGSKADLDKDREIFDQIESI